MAFISTPPKLQQFQRLFAEISTVSTVFLRFFGFAEPQGHVPIQKQKQGQVQVQYQLISFNEMQRPLDFRTSFWRADFHYEMVCAPMKTHPRILTYFEDCAIIIEI